MTGRILVADDDPILRDFIAQGLREHGYVVQEAATIAAALEHARIGQFDLWVLDRRMPGGDCVDALRILRAEGRETPALFLTASRSLEQRIEGFDSGADDYLTKPFSIVELAVRVRALLRRLQVMRENIIRRGVVELHLDERRVIVAGQDLPVTANEWRLLALLAERPGAVFSRAQIMVAVGIDGEAGEAAVDHLVSRTRQKLRERGVDGAIRTVRGQGFAWEFR
jgi:DNA-binding response OmpR family regulator